MYICLCNGITDSKIIAIAGRVTKPSDVHAVCGCTVQCGKCLKHIKPILEEHKNGTD